MDEFFLSCLRAAAANPELVEQFDRLRGTNLMRRGTGFQLAIDEACGRLEGDLAAFADFVREHVYAPLLAELSAGQWFERASPNSIAIGCARGDRLSTASADRTGDRWWVTRVKVAEDDRGTGLGTLMLVRLLARVFEAGATELWVSPGGYGSDPERLAAFYRRVGFEPEGDETMVWRATKSVTPTEG